MIRWIAVLTYYALAFHLPSRNFPGGKTLSRMRGILVRACLQGKCGKGAEIEGGILFGRFNDVEIGENVQINEHCRIRGVKLGNDVMVAPEVYFLHQGHFYERRDVPMRVQGRSFFPQTVVEDDVWIGARAMILPGKTIARGAIVAAGSVVTKDVAAFTIVGGNPAEVIRMRP